MVQNVQRNFTQASGGGMDVSNVPFPIPEGMCYTRSCSVGSVLRSGVGGAHTHGLQILNKSHFKAC